MAYVVDHFVYERWNFSPIMYSMWFAEKPLLQETSKNLPFSLPSDALSRGTTYFRKQAFALFALAQRLATDKGYNVLPILFRDTDTTNSSQKTEWPDKRRSMQARLNSYPPLVCPMLPKPTSEAWLLCALGNNYLNCPDLESTVSASDQSPHHGKKLLDQALGMPFRFDNVVERIIQKSIDISCINMPSLNAFKDDLKTTCHKQTLLHSTLPAHFLQRP